MSVGGKNNMTDQKEYKEKYEIDEAPLVSVMIATYNSKKEKVFRSIKSTLAQKNVSLQIVIADDGSKEDCFDEVEKLFQKEKFLNYKIIKNQVNQGTVKNCLSAIEVCDGKYVKSLGPGDFFYTDTALCRWCDVLEMSNREWSICEAFYYKIGDDGKIILTEQDAHPQNIKPYLEDNQSLCRWNYIVNDDICLGAATLCKVDIVKEYFNIIKDKVIYAEDNIYRLMMLDGLIPVYYPEPMVMYEFGEGVSTSNNQEWNRKLKVDWDQTTQLMLERCNREERIEKKIYRVLYTVKNEKRYQKKIKLLFYRGVFRGKKLKRKSSLLINYDEVEEYN